MTALCVVDGTNGNVVALFLEEGSHIYGKGSVTALVLACLLTVNENDSVVVNCTEVEKDALACPFHRNVKLLSVPHGVHIVHVADARKNAFGAEGNGDLLIKAVSFLELLCKSHLSVVDLELPRSVEVYPLLTHELRTGVFRSWNCHNYVPAFAMYFYL